MNEIMESLWNGNLTPARDCGENNFEIAHLTELIEKNRADLEEKLNSQEKEALTKYAECVQEYIGLITMQAFSDGFCLASKLLTVALV